MDQPLRVYLVDNDLASFNLVLDVLDHAPWVRVVGGTSNPEVALREIPELAVDAIFLDVELPGMGGFELLGRLPVKPAIVIVTKPEPKYALKAFRVQAVDFVSKPASREDLLKATVKAGIELGRVEHWVPSEVLEKMTKAE
jgi:two-component system LytT family response regulator